MSANAAEVAFTEKEILGLGYIAARILDDGSFLAVSPMTYGKGRLVHSENAFGYDEGWCYTNRVEAIDEMDRWNPDDEEKPNGWMREIHTGLRRPDGDPKQEYHRW